MLGYLWASPNTLVGLVLALVSRATGGRWAVHCGVVEVHGGCTRGLLRRMPFVRGGAAAITVGHVVIAVDQSALDRTRCHERVHVRQFERWGPLMPAAYLLAGVLQWLRGKDPYRDNPFEVEAFNDATKTTGKS